MADWGFLTKHARALVCIAHDPGVRLRDLAVELDVTERSAFAIVEDLISGGYVAKEKEGRRNRYHIQVDAPLGEAIGRQETIGELLKLLVGSKRDARLPAHRN
jgi:DNA-binding IclR family transcriptional regulator